MTQDNPTPETVADPEAATDEALGEVETPVDPDHLEVEHIEQVFELRQDAAAQAKLLAGLLGLPEAWHDVRSAVQVDYALAVLRAAKKLGMTAKKAQKLHDISRPVLHCVMEGKDRAAAQQALRDALLPCSCPESVRTDNAFTPSEVGEIGRFFAGHVLCQYTLWSYVFTQQQQYIEQSTELVLEVPGCRGPLRDAAEESLWFQQLEEKKRMEEEAVRQAEEAAKAEAAAKLKEQQDFERSKAEALRQAELAKKPATLDEAVRHAAAVRIEEERRSLESHYRSREQKLQQRIDALQQAAAGGGSG